MVSSATPRRGAAIAAAIGAGLGAGLLGTSLHAHLWRISGTAIPVGALAALLLFGAVALFVGLWSRTGWLSVATGAAAYAAVGVLSIPVGGFGLVQGNLQGELWLYGIAVLTALVGCLAAVMLRPKRKP